MRDRDVALEDALIGAIYDCALDPAQWSPTLQRLCLELDGHSAGIVLLDYDGPNDRLVRDWGPTKTWGDRIAEVLESIKRIHRQFLGLQGPRLQDLILLPRDLAPQIDVFSTAFYQHWAKPQDIHQVLEAVALSEPTRLGLFCITRCTAKGMFTDGQMALLKRLAPHIRRAITISDVLDLRTVERNAFQQVIDSLTAGICIVGEAGEILHANPAAQNLFRSHKVVRSEKGHLRGADASSSAELSASIAAAHQNVTGMGANGIGVPLKGTDGSRAIAHVLPLSNGDIRTRLTPQALAVVFISDGGALPFVDLNAIGRSFEYTPAETKLVGELVAGKSLAESANALGIVESTAKTHLHNIFAKSGVNRQVDLVALINRLTPMTRLAG